MWRVCVVGLAVGACGRLGIEERRTSDDALAMPDALPDALPDMMIDAPPMCPIGTAEIATGSSVCIELQERGTLPWTTAKTTCEGLGRRLCADLEWFSGCVNTPGIIDMTDNEYEWVAEESGGVAEKRGPGQCTDESSHVVTDPYEYRCCSAKM